MPVPSGVVVAWDGALASIPAGWTRATGLDARYPRGADAGVDPGGTGGAASHLHTSAVHSHALAAHTHTASVATSPGSAGGWSGTAGAGVTVAYSHTHPGAGTSSSVTDTSANTTATWNATAADLANYSVVWIQSDGTPAGIPPNGMCYIDTSTVPTGFSQHVASKSVYLKGAAAGVVGGGTTAASTSHTHTAAAHQHTGGGHTHTYSASGPPNNTLGVTSGTSQAASSTHTHTVTGGAGYTGGTPGYQSSLGTSAATASAALPDPPFATLPVVYNSSGAVAYPLGLICLWPGLLSTIPPGWRLCDGTGGTLDLRGKFAKAANLLTDVGATGGSLSHTHTAPAGHQHDDQGHVHVLSWDADLGPAAGMTVNTTSTIDISGHTHGNQGGIAAGETASSSVTTNAYAATAQAVTALADSRPPWYDVAYIKLFDPGIVVTVTSPTEASVVPGPSFAVSWTLDGARTPASYRLRVYQPDGVTVAYDSGTVSSSALTATVPLGYLQSGNNYKLTVYATDTNGIAGLSAVRSFSVQSVVVTVTAPTEGQAMPAPPWTVSWTLDGARTQNDYRLRLYQPDGTTLLYDSGKVAAAALSATMPAGYMFNGQSYKLSVAVTDTDGVTGTSAQRSFSEAFTPPATVTGLTTSPVGGT